MVRELETKLSERFGDAIDRVVKTEGNRMAPVDKLVARALVVFVAFSILSGIGYSIFALATGLFPGWFTASIFLSGILQVGSLYLLRTRDYPRWAGVYSITIVVLMNHLIMAAFGGSITPLIIWIPIYAVLAVFFVGRRFGVVVFAYLTLVAASYFLEAEFALTPPNLAINAQELGMLAYASYFPMVAVLVGFVSYLATGMRHLHDNLERAHRTAEASGALLGAAIDAGDIAIWDWTLPDNQMWLSDTWFKQLGYKPGELANSLDTWAELVHPDDASETAAAMISHFENRASHFDTRSRMRHKEGHYRWIQSTAQKIEDESGNVQRVIGIQQDITDQICLDPSTGVPNESGMQLWMQSVQTDIDGIRFALAVELTSKSLSGRFDNGHRFATAIRQSYDALDDVLRATSGVQDTYVAFSIRSQFLVGGIATSEELVKKQVIPAASDTLLDILRDEFPDRIFAASIGAAFARDKEQPTQKIVDRARVAAEHHRRERSGPFRKWKPGLRDRLQSDERLAADLIQAVQEGKLEAHIQPIMHSADERIAGYELLCRWTHPTLGTVPPARFIPVATEHGLLPEITMALTSNAISKIKRLVEDLPPGETIFLSVNFTANLFSDNAWLHSFMAMVQKASASLPLHFHFEITESEFVTDSPEFNQGLQLARNAGVKISLDDFGTGYSNLAYLNRLPIDAIKIDRSFFLALESSNRDDALSLLESVVGLSKALERVTIAEGIETEFQASTARRLGCELVQGYRFGRPEPV